MNSLDHRPALHRIGRMPDVSIVIVTRDRKQTAEKAVASAVEQEGDHEVLVYDDASTDGSADYIAAKFPGVRVQRAEQRAGYIVQRNRATRLAAGRVILAVDDDAVFTDRATARQTLRLFEHPRVGAVSVPFVNHINGQDSSMLLDP